MHARTEQAPAASPAAIQLTEVGLTYAGSAGAVHALHAVSLDVQPRQFVSILGPSGCGKSTLLKIIAGFIAPANGTVSVGGISSQQAREAGRIGMVFQSPVLLLWRTVLDNIAFLLEISGKSRPEREATARRYVEIVGLQGFEDHLPHELSGGMQQRVSIARALAFGPSILLMDEPFGALDAMTRDRMALDLLDIWKRDQRTVLFITHSVAEAVFLSDVVVVMTPRPGRVRSIHRIDLARPRGVDVRHDARFAAYCRTLLADLEVHET